MVASGRLVVSGEVGQRCEVISICDRPGKFEGCHATTDHRHAFQSVCSRHSCKRVDEQALICVGTGSGLFLSPVCCCPRGPSQVVVSDHMHLCSSLLTPVSCAEQDSGQWVPIVGFDCRGLEPVGFHSEVWMHSPDCCLALPQCMTVYTRIESSS